MAEPVSRQTFKDFIKRKLGYPLLDINISEDQLDDRVDEALSFYRDYHNDGTEKVYLKHVVTAEDKVNGYIPISDLVSFVVQVFPIISDKNSSEQLFNLQYQIAQSDLFTVSGMNMLPLVVAMTQLQNLQFFLGNYPTINYNRHTDKLYLIMDWKNKVQVGDTIIVECYRVLDPLEYPNVWKDMWLKKYATALTKEQWGQNLIKFNGVQMAGGITLNGQKIFDEGKKDREDLEKEMINGYSLPVNFFMG